MYSERYHTSVLKQGQLSKGKRKFPWKTVISIIVLLIVCSGAIYVCKDPRLQVRNIVVTGAHVVDPLDVSTFVSKELSGTYFSLLPKTSIFLIQQHVLARHIQAAFPRLKSVDVDRSSFSSLAITVVEYPGKYLWCVEESTECSFMDERGEVFASAPYFSGSAYRKIFSGEMGTYPFRSVNDAQITTITMLIEKLQAISIDPLEFHYKSNRQLVVVYAHNGKLVNIVFDPSRSIEGQLALLYTGITTEPFAAQYRDKTKILEYIDLRFSNKIVYKFQ